MLPALPGRATSIAFDSDATVKLYIGITDYDWFNLHASKLMVEEVNFWRPSSQVAFKALEWGEPFLFKLHAPRNFIVGGGFFTKYLRLRVGLAWRVFREANGARSLGDVRSRIARYRKQPIAPTEDPFIGCILLEEPFFFAEADWIRCPPDFNLATQQGKSYDMQSGTGQRLWAEVRETLQRSVAYRASTTARPAIGPAITAAVNSPRFGKPVLVTPRLGQGSFRVLVTDAYHNRCAMTAERTLPVLEAAHIRPHSEEGENALSNGLLLRSDLHTLFDEGYVTVDPNDKRIIVSRRIREEFENGRDYYALHGRKLAQPDNPLACPSSENLHYHVENVFECKQFLMGA